MIYVYQESNDKYIITEEKLENNTIPILVLRWTTLPINNIRPWKYLKYNRKNYYKPGVLDYLKSHLSEETPQEETLSFIYKNQVEEEFKKYTEILGLFKSLGLIKNIPALNYNHVIIYSCDIKNYLEDILGKDLIEKCEEFIRLEKYKRDIIINLGKLRTDDEKIKYLENNEVDNDIYQFLPPWLKVSYQVIGEGQKTIKRKKIPNIEYNESGRI